MVSADVLAHRFIDVVSDHYGGLDDNVLDQCGFCSAAFHTILQSNGIDSVIKRGIVAVGGGISHVWVESNGTTYDFTMSQFYNGNTQYIYGRDEYIELLLSIDESYTPSAMDFEDDMTKALLGAWSN